MRRFDRRHSRSPRATGSAGFDRLDQVGGNTYRDNVFKKENVD